jgi:hypothetical protein
MIFMTSLNLKNAVSWDVTPCHSCKNRSFGGTTRLHHHAEYTQGARNNIRGN